jgi:MarR family transcriptional regulator, temperature-dependent positive regulator of motility
MTANRPRSANARETEAPVAINVRELPGHLIRLAQQLHKRLWVSEVSAEITSPQYGILNAILADPGIDQKTAGEEVGIDKSTVGDVVYRLAERGLIHTIRDPEDQRRNLLHLSRAGRQAVTELAPRILEMNRKLVASLSQDEQDVLVRLLETLVEGVSDNGAA